MTTQKHLATLVRESEGLVTRFVKGFDDINATTQPTNLPNHLIWTLGHLAITCYRGAARVDTVPPPAVFFVEGTAGDTQHFGIQSVGFGSKPVADPSIYPTLARALEIFESSVERIAAAVEAMDDAGLDKQVPWGQGTISQSSMVGRLLFHNGTHAGEIIDLRRALGLSPVVG